jgi:thiosulfate reductase cytochrome b subunit
MLQNPNDMSSIYLYPKAIRIWHWLNALCFLLLIISGVSLQYADPEGAVLPFRFSITLHNVSAIVVSITFVCYLFANFFTGNGRYYRFNKDDGWKGLVKQARYYLNGIFKGEDHPFHESEERKFNPLQKLTYVLAMFIGMPLLILTGLALFFPEIILPKVFGVNGILMTSLLHSIIGFVFTLFLLVHVYLCTIGKNPWASFKAMLSGFKSV